VEKRRKRRDAQLRRLTRAHGTTTAGAGGCGAARFPKNPGDEKAGANLYKSAALLKRTPHFSTRLLVFLAPHTPSAATAPPLERIRAPNHLHSPDLLNGAEEKPRRLEEGSENNLLLTRIIISCLLYV
jgi:hypothetical protein